MGSSPFHPLGPAHYDPEKSELQPPGQPCKRVAVLFATRQGHTMRIAERITTDLLVLGFDVDLLAVRKRLPYPLSKYCAAVLAASVHAGSHEKEMVEFVKNHRLVLGRIRTAFLSVTLSEAGAEMPDKSPTEHARFAQDVEQMLERFYVQTNWHPTVAKPVAGALLFTHYNFLVRMIMKRIARKAGAATDTSRDYVYTDWLGLDRFASELATEIRGAPVVTTTVERGLHSGGPEGTINPL